MQPTNSNYFISVNGPTNTYRVTGDGTDVLDFGTVQQNIWTHITVVFQSDGTVNCYVDGVIQGNGTINLNTNLASVSTSIGKVNGSFPGFYDGSIDNLQIWSTALSQSEIQNYMNCPPTGNESGLVGYWNFEEGSGTTATRPNIKWK